MNLDDVLIAVFLLVWLIPSLTLHEYGHAKMADRLGDRTPRLAGRLTLNPIPHIDPFGTVILPGLLLLLVAFGRTVLPVFAFAKPTPFNPSNFRDPNKGTMWTAFAGPLVNLILAVLAALLLRVLAPRTIDTLQLFGPSLRAAVEVSYLGGFLVAGLVVNVILFIFNLMPIPGLDGSKVLARYLPPRAREVYRNLDQYLILFVMVVVFILPGPFFAIVSGLGNGICSLIVGGDCI